MLLGLSWQNGKFQTLNSINCDDAWTTYCNKGINERNLKIWADVADKICFSRTIKFGSGSWFSGVRSPCDDVHCMISRKESWKYKKAKHMIYMKLKYFFFFYFSEHGTVVDNNIYCGDMSITTVQKGEQKNLSNLKRMSRDAFKTNKDLTCFCTSR